MADEKTIQGTGLESIEAEKTESSASEGAVVTEGAGEVSEAGDATERDVREGEAGAMPEAKMNKMNTMVMIVMAVLLVVAIVTMIVIPPNGAQPVSSSSEQQFVIATRTKLLTPGFNPEEELRYLPAETLRTPVIYNLFIQEENRYEGRGDVKTEFTAKLVLRQDASNKHAESFLVSFRDVKVEVFDNGVSKNVQDVGAMMPDIILEGRLDPVKGMSRLVPLDKINPQIGRVLYIVTDVVRDAFMGLPEGRVGTGGLWENEIRNSEGDKHSVVMTVNRKGGSLYEVHFSERYDGLSRGGGTAQWVFSGGRVDEFKGSIQSELVGNGQEKVPHSLSFSLMRTDEVLSEDD